MVAPIKPYFRALFVSCGINLLLDVIQGLMLEKSCPSYILKQMDSLPIIAISIKWGIAN